MLTERPRTAILWFAPSFRFVHVGIATSVEIYQ